MTDKNALPIPHRAPKLHPLMNPLTKLPTRSVTGALAAFILLVALIASITSARAAAPTITVMNPQGFQKGTETEVTFTGSRLADVEEILFYDNRITNKGIVSAEGNKLVVKVAVAADAPLGVHRMRLRSRTGVSYVKLFTVGPFPSINEEEPNTAFEEAQAVPLNHTVEGYVNTEDVDHFRVTAKKGDRISVEVEGWRLGNVNFDPYLAILNSEQFEVASCDDALLLKQDAYVSYEVEEDGDYTILLRDSSYLGNNRSRYRLHVGNFTRPAFLYPLGGKAGQEREFTVFSQTGEITKKKLALPAEEALAHPFELTFEGTPTPSPNYLRVSNFDDMMEQEPANDSRNSAQVIPSIPFAVNGIIQKDRDRDYYKVHLKKNQTIAMTALGATLHSPIDTMVGIYDANGKHLKTADDVGRNPDGSQTYKATADGDYFILVRDRLELGDPLKAYRLEITWPKPALTVTFPDFRNNDSMYRQFVAIARGDRFSTLCNIRRQGANGDLKFSIPNLPDGVRLLTPEIKDGSNSFPLVLEASPDAPIGGTLSPLIVETTGEKKIVGNLKHTFDFI